MDSQEESSSAIAPSLMASLDVAYNYLSLKAGKLCTVHIQQHIYIFCGRRVCSCP